MELHPYTLSSHFMQHHSVCFSSPQFAAINIQDPFCLDHNITLNIVEKMREKFMRELRIAAIKTSVWHNDGFMMGAQGASVVSNWFNCEIYV